MADPIVDEFIEEARAVSIEDVASRLGLTFKRGFENAVERMGPCPVCGGKDRFSINTAKNVWLCRGAGGGHDAIGLAAHVLDYTNLNDRSQFLAACAAVTGKDIPEGGERESAADRADRQDRIAKRQADAQRSSEKNAQSQVDFREAAVNKARGIYLQAGDAAGSDVAEYLRRRAGFEMPEELFTNLRFVARHTYWHGSDDRGHAQSLHCGPAMIAPMVNPANRITGCHQTWIDLDGAPKWRPRLMQNGELLVTKKMLGTKKGSFIPLIGLPAHNRWMIGEGIETVLAMAGAEGFRTDTFYCAAGDMGNLCGPAEASSGFPHPTLKKETANGQMRALRVQGPQPKADQAADDAVQVPNHVDEVVILADGDSEIVATAAAIARAVTRLSRDGRLVFDWWPPQGHDWADIILRGMAA